MAKLIQYYTLYDNKSEKVLMLIPHYAPSLRQIIDSNGPVTNECIVEIISFQYCT